MSKITNKKITLDSISRADLHELVKDLHKRLEDVENNKVGLYDYYENGAGESIDVIQKLIDDVDKIECRLDKLEDEAIDARDRILKLECAEKSRSRRVTQIIKHKEVETMGKEKEVTGIEFICDVIKGAIVFFIIWWVYSGITDNARDIDNLESIVRLSVDCDTLNTKVDPHTYYNYCKNKGGE